MFSAPREEVNYAVNEGFVGARPKIDRWLHAYDAPFSHQRTRKEICMYGVDMYKSVSGMSGT